MYSKFCLSLGISPGFLRQSAPFPKESHGCKLCDCARPSWELAVELVDLLEQCGF